MNNIIICVIILCILLWYGCNNNREGFTDAEIKSKANEIHKNKDLFYPGANYTDVKQNMSWIDPVIYNDIYKLSLKENLTINNLENTLYNSIQLH